MRDSCFNLVLLIGSLAFAGLSLSCETSTSSHASGETPQFGGLVERELPIQKSSGEVVQINQHRSDGSKQYLVEYNLTNPRENNSRRYVALSEDSGRSFTAVRDFSRLFPAEFAGSYVDFGFCGNSIVAVLHKSSELFFSSSEKGLRFSELQKITDAPNSIESPLSIACLDQSRFAVSWTDTREASPRIYYSTSSNGGRQCQTNAPVDSGVGVGNQERPKLTALENGRLIVVWVDWRDKRTLADIRYSISDDDGRTWSKSAKLNDDGLPVWQIDPSVVKIGQTVLVAFADFREDGEFGDRDWNIYLARSPDNGSTWEENYRLNSTKPGRQLSPVLAASTDGLVYVSYVTTGGTIFGQYVASVSGDQGKTWAREIPLTSSSAKTMQIPAMVAAFEGRETAIILATHSDTGFKRNIRFTGPSGEVPDGAHVSQSGAPSDLERELIGGVQAWKDRV